MAFETLRTAWIGLMSHRLRTALTVLGITIGIASVIVLIAVGKGSSDAVQESIDALGSNTLTVTASSGVSTVGAAATALTLEKDDAEALEDAERAPAIASVSPVVSASGAELTYGESSYEPGEFIGTTPSYAEARNYEVESGTFVVVPKPRSDRLLVSTEARWRRRAGIGSRSSGAGRSGRNRAMTETTKCPYCGWDVELIGAGEGDAARILYGKEAGVMVTGARHLQYGETVILHHICSDPRFSEATELEQRDAWWACKEPDRKPDRHLHHDLNCAACAERWIAGRVN